MPRLKDREKQIPGGLRFYEPALKWKPPPYASFNVIVTELIRARRANPYLVKKNAWAIDYTSVANEVDSYNASICKSHRWDQYITEDGGQPPNPMLAHSGLRQAVGHAAVGVNVVMEMFGKEGPIRDLQLAEKRGSVCAECAMNDQGDWTRFFTVPAQSFVRKALGIAKDLDLKTSLDSKLNICTACGCPLKGKVWARLDHIVKHMPEFDRRKLPDNCWIITEQESCKPPTQS